jgi:DnaK suppressor protein
VWFQYTYAFLSFRRSQERTHNTKIVVSGESKLVTAKAKPKAKADGKKAKVESGKAKAKPAPKVVAKAKPAPKAVAKPKAKPAPKLAAKVAAKPVSKPVTKLPVNSVEKAKQPAVPKTETKPAPKTSSKTETRIPGVLTEAELIKQPKSEYMSVAQRNFFKHRLIELQTQMRDNADATTEHLRELAVAPDPADRATQEEEHALELRTRDRERKLLKKIEAALLRIEDGSYGYCEETGDPIGVPRLLARPTATLTIEAQERRELKQKMYGE